MLKHVAHCGTWQRRSFPNTRRCTLERDLDTVDHAVTICTSPLITNTEKKHINFKYVTLNKSFHSVYTCVCVITFHPG